MPQDTTAQAQEIQSRIYRQMSPDQKLQRVYELTRLTRELARSRIRQHNPGISDREVTNILIEELYGFRPPARNDDPCCD